MVIFCRRGLENRRYSVGDRERECVRRSEGWKGEKKNGEDDGGSGVRKEGCDKKEKSRIGRCKQTVKYIGTYIQ